MKQTILTRVRSINTQPRTIRALQKIASNYMNEINALEVGVSYGSLFDQLQNRLFIIYLRGRSLLGVHREFVVLSEKEAVFIPDKTLKELRIPNDAPATITILGKAQIVEEEDE